jgi:Uri superfamily endonuclease
MSRTTKKLQKRRVFPATSVQDYSSMDMKCHIKINTYAKTRYRSHAHIGYLDGCASGVRIVLVECDLRPNCALITWSRYSSLGSEVTVVWEFGCGCVKLLLQFFYIVVSEVSSCCQFCFLHHFYSIYVYNLLVYRTSWCRVGLNHPTIDPSKAKI